LHNFFHASPPPQISSRLVYEKKEEVFFIR
jgi:hypothetical protein